ncbi:LTA synthase family protein [Avibacterium gallinarum]|uniref:Phosphoglycerol transferase n=1 Tax=Avibacterium gallinarum TaxID=755 RepID=A0A379AU88_AVIGA|nr:LTA synthase family protein [Avibacterium gallinarum]TDP29526.1 phosphoglycerol transferase MdoB-like AlkP superfamily enzyme [Avibacterium gallinarum]SUB25896.1 phosphoglycerol transferase [Avibacterium gallinarum]
MNCLKKRLGAFSPIFIFFCINLIILSISRLLLGIWQADRISAVEGWLPLFLQGIRIDVASLCWLFALPILLTCFLAGSGSVGRLVNGFVRVWLVLSGVFIIFMEIATPAFIETYDFRPNRLFVEYLVNPKEVFTMLANGHILALILTPILTALFAYGFWRLSANLWKNVSYPKWYWRPVVFLLVGALTFIGARSSFQHRGINPAMVAFSSDPLVNSLVLNSSYSVMFAIQQMKDEDRSSEIYGKMPLDEVVATLKQVRGRPASDYISDSLPTMTKNVASYQGKPKNLVIILEESLGAQFVQTLGGKPLSPHFDELAKEGWLFENLYATGTRSVRGIEAVTAGFTPTPARSVVKLSGSQNNFFTIADFLKQQGYQTSFIYGGEKHFDNMASFFYGNGFETIIDEKDYKNPRFTATWGVSDEDLFAKANEQFSQWQTSGKPFFSLVFTSSNHDPFEFPDGKIELYEQPKQTRNNAAKYADYALGYFFQLAKKSNYWQDTVFLVIADHDSRVNGSTLVPIKHFHIPALILGEGIAPRRDNRLVSQIDMPTTLLSLIGASGNYPMLGYDLTQPQDPNRALMQFDRTMAYRKGDDVAILQQNQPVQGFRYDAQAGKLIPAEIPEAMKKEALAYALWGSYAYKQKLYRTMPATKSK